MRLACEKDVLSEAFGTVARAIAPRSTLPVLANIAMFAEDGWLTLRATNLEFSIETTVKAEVETAGSTTIPARTITDLLKAMSGDMVFFSLSDTGKTLSVECGRLKNNLRTIDANDFPALPKAGNITITLQPDILRDAIDKVAFAAAKDESRPILCGVLFKMVVVDGQTTLAMAAADGFRLSVYTTGVNQQIDNDVSVIIPAKALKEVSRVIGYDPVLLSISESGNSVVFTAGETSVASQLIDGNFPQFEAIIPKETTTTATVSVDKFVLACKAASVFARDAANIMKMSVTNGDVEVSSQASETGDNKGHIECDTTGDDVTIAFNAGYVLDMLNVMDGDSVVVELSEATRPGLFRAVNDDKFIHVIMPMHIKDA